MAITRLVWGITLLLNTSKWGSLLLQTSYYRKLPSIWWIRMSSTKIISSTQSCGRNHLFNRARFNHCRDLNMICIRTFLHVPFDLHSNVVSIILTAEKECQQPIFILDAYDRIATFNISTSNKELLFDIHLRLTMRRPMNMKTVSQPAWIKFYCQWQAARAWNKSVSRPLL